MDVEDKELDEFNIDESELNDTQIKDQDEMSEEEVQAPTLTPAEPEPEFVEQSGPRTMRFRNYHPRDTKLREYVIPPPKDQLKPNLKRFEQISRYDGDEVCSAILMIELNMFRPC